MAIESILDLLAFFLLSLRGMHASLCRSTEEGGLNKLTGHLDI